MSNLYINNIKFKNSYTLYEQTIKCEIKDYEFNASYNPTLGSGSTYLIQTPTTISEYKCLPSTSTINTEITTPQIEANLTVFSVKQQSDGKILIAGAFTSVNGNTNAKYITRLNEYGEIDSTFTSPNLTVTGTPFILDFDIQSDGKIIIVGFFDGVNGSLKKGICRLNSNGTIDSTYNIGNGFQQKLFGTSTPAKIKILPDNTSIVTGDFYYYDNVVVNCIVKINSNGSINIPFDNNISPGLVATGTFTTIFGTGIDIDSNGDLYLSIFSTASPSNVLVGGVPNGYVVKFDQNGVIDTTFRNNFFNGFGVNGGVRSIKVLSDDTIMLGGQFDIFSIAGSVASSISIIKLNNNGTVNTTYPSTPFTFVNPIYSIDEDSSGFIYLGGGFTENSTGNSVKNIIKIDPLTGVVQTSYDTNPGTDFPVRSIKVLSSNKVMLGGQFDQYSGSIASKIAYTNPNGTLITGSTYISSSTENTIVCKNYETFIPSSGWITSSVLPPNYTGSYYVYPDNTLKDFATASYFNPYITTVGLYNDSNQLLAIAKLAQPLPKSNETDTTILIKLDY